MNEYEREGGKKVGWEESQQMSKAHFFFAFFSLEGFRGGPVWAHYKGVS